MFFGGARISSDWLEPRENNSNQPSHQVGACLIFNYFPGLKPSPLGHVRLQSERITCITTNNKSNLEQNKSDERSIY